MYFSEKEIEIIKDSLKVFAEAKQSQEKQKTIIIDLFKDKIPKEFMNNLSEAENSYYSDDIYILIGKIVQQQKTENKKAARE